MNLIRSLQLKIATGCVSRYVTQDILVHFYRSGIEPILTFFIIVWFDGITETQKLQLNRIVKTASKIVGCSLPTLEDIHVQRVKKHSEKIIEDTSHPANHLFELLPLRRRYRRLKCGTTRSRQSFFPACSPNNER